MKNRSSRLLLVGLLLLAGCATTAQEKQQAEREDLATEVRDEVAVGREMAAKLYGHFGRYESSAPLTGYVRLVGGNLADSAGRPELRYRFGILDTDEVNAFATPGGYVFVTRGLLAEVHGEAELAAVLAHEIAHVNEKHMYLGIAPKRQVSAEESMARIMSRGRADLGKSLTVIADKGLKLLLEGGLGKEKEQQADQEALLMVSWLGYDPQAFVGLLQRLQADKAKLKFGKVAQAFDQRIAALTAFMKGNGVTDRKIADDGVLQKRFARAWGTLAQK